MNEITLYSSSLVLGENSTNKTFYFNFYVPAGCNRIVIDFSYKPDVMDEGEQRKTKVKECLRKYMPPPYDTELNALVNAGFDLQNFPLHNLITLSVDNAAGEYVGCAHRHECRQTHEISLSKSSYGFRKIATNEGVWRIAVQCHAVVTPVVEVCTTIRGDV